MTLVQEITVIGLCAIATILTRFLPFALFSKKGELPKYVKYIGDVLPGAVFAMLVVYCLKSVTPLTYSYGLPELISIALVVGIHLWRRNMLLSIASGTVCYMLLVQLVF